MDHAAYNHTLAKILVEYASAVGSSCANYIAFTIFPDVFIVVLLILLISWHM